VQLTGIPAAGRLRVPSSVLFDHIYTLPPRGFTCRPCRRALALCAAASLCAGCAAWFADPPGTHTLAKPLPKIGVSQEAMVVEAIFAERPIGDPLLADVWQDVDQIGALEPHIREALRQNDIRVGVAGSMPTRSMETLLGLSASRAKLHKRLTALDSSPMPLDGGGGVVGHRYWLRHGAETTIQTSPFYETCRVEVADGAGRTTREYTQARCIFRVQAQRLQDGWAKLVFLPEIHHGEQRIRHRAGDFQWKLSHEQEIERFYPQRFELTLNVGEMAVISLDGKEPHSLGRCFFRGTDEGGAEPGGDTLQRVLIVRLAEMGAGNGVYAE
jgi:hypothetical protein